MEEGRKGERPPRLYQSVFAEKTGYVRDPYAG